MLPNWNNYTKIVNNLLKVDFTIEVSHVSPSIINGRGFIAYNAIGYLGHNIFKGNHT